MILNQLGIFGWKEADESLVLASLLTGEPLLLIGNHGCAKTHVVNKLAQALGRKFLGFSTQVKWVQAAMNPISYSATQALDNAFVGRFAIFRYPPDVPQMDETDGHVTPVGADQVETEVDVLILAATNRDLPTLIREGKFRADLFHRLATLRIEVPPLRERKEDRRAWELHGQSIATAAKALGVSENTLRYKLMAGE